MTVPGVSGGSMAMIVGIYDRLIYSVSNIFKEPKKCLIFLAQVMLGAAAGMLMLARLIDRLINEAPMTTGYFFLGAVMGGIPLILKEADLKEAVCKGRARAYIPIYVALGVACVYLLTLLPKELLNISDDFTLSYIGIQLLGGLIISVALVLPGISTSHMLLMLGLYEPVIKAIKSLDIWAVTPLAVGILVGTFLTSRALDMLFSKYKSQTYMLVLGFLLGSISELFPGLPGRVEILPCIAALLCGCFAVYMIGRLGEHKSREIG